MKTKRVVLDTGFTGYWGEGKTISEALTNAEWLKEEDTVTLYLCSEDAQVLDNGTIHGKFVRRVGVGRMRCNREGRPFLDLEVE